MAELIALTGPQQVGKTTAASSLARNHDFVHLSFADPIYAMIAALMGVDIEEIRLLDKNEPRRELEGKNLRYALQTLGTEWGRKLVGKNLWLNNCILRAQKCMKHGKSVVVDDCRFLNEYQAIKQAGAKIVRLKREDMPPQTNPGHGSEVEWPKFDPDATVLNPSDGVKNWSTLAGKAILAALEIKS